MRPRRWVATSIALWLAAGSSTYALPTERSVGPISGITYEFTHSCLTGIMQYVIRGNSSQEIETKLYLDDGSNNPLEVTSRFTRPPGFDFAPRITGWGIGRRAGTYLHTERATAGGDAVETRRGTWSCPDYASLPRSVFVPINPTRVLDTRAATAINYGGAKPGPGSTITVPATALPGLPANAVAVSANVTMVEADAPGYLQALPSGTPPGGSSTVNARYPGHSIANSTVTALGADRGLSIYNLNGGHVLLDVNGYFVSATGPTAAGRLTTFDATRVLDTRVTSRIGYDGSKPEPGARVRIDMDAAAPIPAGAASAVIVNITATESDAAGYVQAAAAGSLVPGASSAVNLVGPGQTAAGLAIVPVSADGSIELATLSGTHLIVDAVGWFTNDTAAVSAAGQFVPITPDRLFDSRYSSPVNCCGLFDPGSFTQFYDQPTGTYRAGAKFGLGADEIEEIAQSMLLNVTNVNNPSPGFIQLGSAALVPGSASNVNFVEPGQTVANSAVVPVSRDRNGFTNLDVYMSAGGGVVLDLSGFFTKG